ncbi:MAG TPA: hypothetical protein VHJ54_04975 [Solirubrobacterales bacterium]|nr:hypothetical protein [Solirubrobacterales bacterium]
MPTVGGKYVALGVVVACAERLGCADRFANLEALIEANGAIRQRRAGRDGGARAVTRCLRDRFLAS